LVNDLMDASKIDEGKFELPSEPLDLQALVGEVVKEVSPLAVKKAVKLNFMTSTKPLPPVKINKQKVKQVLQNLIDNAIKYSSSAAKGEVNVAVTQVEKNIQFQVRDNGIGIPEADKGHIFERFYRGSNSTKLDPGGGSGLGLYIAKGVVEQSGGKIWFESKEGEGTSFFATFPAANAK
jgi:signal transduction histidine kinase